MKLFQRVLNSYQHLIIAIIFALSLLIGSVAPAAANQVTWELSGANFEFSAPSNGVLDGTFYGQFICDTDTQLISTWHITAELEWYLMDDTDPSGLMSLGTNKVTFANDALDAECDATRKAPLYSFGDPPYEELDFRRVEGRGTATETNYLLGLVFAYIDGSALGSPQSSPIMIWSRPGPNEGLWSGLYVSGYDVGPYGLTYETLYAAPDPYIVAVCNPVPEPSSLFLFCYGLAGLVVWGRKKSKHIQSFKYE